VNQLARNWWRIYGSNVSKPKGIIYAKIIMRVMVCIELLFFVSCRTQHDVSVEVRWGSDSGLIPVPGIKLKVVSRQD